MEGKASPDRLHKHSFRKVIFSLFFLTKKVCCANTQFYRSCYHSGNTLELRPFSAQQPENQTRMLPYKSTTPSFDVCTPIPTPHPWKKDNNTRIFNRITRWKTEFFSLKKRHLKEEKIEAYKIMKNMQTANRNDCSLFAMKRKGCFFPAGLLNCRTLLPQNTFKARSIAAFKKWLDLLFNNFLYQWLHNTVQMQPPLYQVPKWLTTMRKKDTLKPFIVIVGEKWATQIFGLTAV